MTLKIIFTLICLISSLSLSQTIDSTDLGFFYKFESSNSPFQHEKRLAGHTYREELYSFKDHYQDSTVLLFLPKNLKDDIPLDIVFYFHGWWNNIDTSITKFNLINQFLGSKKNAVLVLPEAAKNAPDSFGGKLEEKGIFEKLTSEVIHHTNQLTLKNFRIGNITLAGHSGGYRVISYIILHGGNVERIKNVILFDGLYADVEKYSYWINNYSGKFYNIYTPNGGTKTESENLMLCFNAWKIQYEILHDDFTVDDLKKSRIIFIESTLGHSEVIHTYNQFQKFLESCL